MRSFSVLFLIVPFLVLSCFSSYADTVTPTNVSGASGAQSKKKKVKVVSKAKKPPNKILGRCNVVESPQNPIPGPCVDILLVLNDSDGHELYKARTLTNGEFEFVAESDKAYHLASGSRYYQIVSPLQQVRAGDRVDLKLQQK